jgi:hypothetical protein
MTTINMCIIFFIFGITLETSELKEAVKAVRSLSTGLVSILLLTCLTGFIPLMIPFKPYEFSVGLAIMACVPTSLSSGVSLVIGSYGNGALALLFTVSSNLVGARRAGGVPAGAAAGAAAAGGSGAQRRVPAAEQGVRAAVRGRARPCCRAAGEPPPPPPPPPPRTARRSAS